MRRTNIYLEERQTALLDARARAEGVTRAEVIRRLLDLALAGGTGVTGDLDAIEASFGVAADDEPVGQPLPSRAPDERARHLDRMWRS